MLPGIWKFVDTITSAKQPYYTFMSEVREVFAGDVDGIDLNHRAYLASSKGHHNQFRDSGERYFLHVLSVACILLWLMKRGVIKPDPALIAAALLHDLIEDKPKRWNRKRVKREFGTRVERYVWAVTKPRKAKFKGDRRARNIAAYKKVRRYGRFTMILRIADRLHNIKTPWGTRRDVFQYLKETEEFAFPMAVELDILVEEIRVAMEEVRELLDTEAEFIMHDRGTATP